jgi:ribosomal protein S18 acetylase RimI-like enzyme
VDDDSRRMQELVATAWRLEGPLVQHHVGDVAWSRYSIAGREHEWRFRLWEDAGAVVAWAWLHLPAQLDFQLHPRRRELLDEVLDWFEAQANGERATWALVEDAATVAGLERRGYRRAGPDEPWFAHLSRPVDAVEAPALPEGFTVRHVRGEEDVGRRVAVHRAAWHPSRVTEESHRAVMAAHPYRRELDCVVEAPDGSFAAYCLAWLDEENRVGELEPVGTDPRFRRRGLAAAVCTHAVAQLRAHGAETAIVYARGDPAYPAPRRLYESIGFRAYAGRRSWYAACS